MATDNDSIIVPAHLEAGILRLLAAPLDLADCGARVWADPPGHTGSGEHRRLFAAYLGALDRVVPEARRIWLAVIADVQTKIPDRRAAMLNALQFQVAGAAFDGCVIAVIRQFWLECDRLNDEVSSHERVAPQHFVLDWLVRAGKRDAVEVLGGMPYWPIGLDRDGRWV